MPVGKLKENIWNFFFCGILKVTEVGCGSGSVNQRFGSGSASKCHGSSTLQIDEYCSRRREEQGRLSPGFQPQYTVYRSQDCAHWGRGAQVSTELHRSVTISTLFKEEFRVWIRSLTRIRFLFYISFSGGWGAVYKDVSNILIVAFGLFFTK